MAHYTYRENSDEWLGLRSKEAGIITSQYYTHESSQDWNSPRLVRAAYLTGKLHSGSSERVTYGNFDLSFAFNLAFSPLHRRRH